MADKYYCVAKENSLAVTDGKKWQKNVLVPLTAIKAENSDGQHISDAFDDIQRGFPSMSYGNILLTVDEQGYYEIADGFHRAAEAVLRKETHIFADIILN